MTIRNQSEGRAIKQMAADFTKDVVPNFTRPDYDVVLDKNVLDCFIISNDPLHNNEVRQEHSKQLKAGGLYIMLSLSSENARLRILDINLTDFVYRQTKGIKWKRVTCIRIPKQHTGMKPVKQKK